MRHERRPRLAAPHAALVRPAAHRPGRRERGVGLDVREVPEGAQPRARPARVAPGRDRPGVPGAARRPAGVRRRPAPRPPDRHRHRPRGLRALHGRRRGGRPAPEVEAMVRAQAAKRVGLQFVERRRASGTTASSARACTRTPSAAPRPGRRAAAGRPPGGSCPAVRRKSGASAWTSVRRGAWPLAAAGSLPAHAGPGRPGEPPHGGHPQMHGRHRARPGLRLAAAAAALAVAALAAPSAQAASPAWQCRASALSAALAGNPAVEPVVAGGGATCADARPGSRPAPVGRPAGHPPDRRHRVGADDGRPRHGRDLRAAHRRRRAGRGPRPAAPARRRDGHPRRPPRGRPRGRRVRGRPAPARRRQRAARPLRQRLERVGRRRSPSACRPPSRRWRRSSTSASTSRSATRPA